MKLTKYTHACVLVDDGEHTALFDPGEFTERAGQLNIGALAKLDFVLITHEHFDHYSEDLIKRIVEKFPEVVFYTNKSVAKMLEEVGANTIRTESDELVSIKQLDHQSMAPLAPLPMCDNVEMHYKGVISHPGDSHQMQTTSDILFVPLAGPWGATIEGIRMADKLKPQFIMPIHDWMWNDTWRADMYDRMETYFAKQGIQVLLPVDGQVIEINT